MVNAKILIIDDHVLFAEGLKAQLRQFAPPEDIRVEKDATAFLRRMDTMPGIELLIVDINMPDINGLDLIARLKPQYPDMKILVISANSDEGIAARAMDTGASGYICKSSDVLIMVEGIKAVLRGDSFVDPGVVSLVDGPLDKPDATRIPPRTLQVLEYIARGHSNKAIADILGISEATVKWHVSRLFDALSVRNRTSCVNKAVQLGLIASDR